MADAIPVVRRAMAQLSAGRCLLPERTHLDVTEQDGVVLVMSCLAPEENRITVKAITLYGRNAQFGLPHVHAVVLLLDAANGVPLAIMDGAALTAIRTGAGSGVATDLLARADARSVAIFGAGRQARTQLEAVACVRQLTGAWIFDPDAEAARRFAEEMSANLGISVEQASSPAAAMDGADIVCTATVSPVPVFDDCDVRPGMHINAIGSYKPHVREIPGATVARSRVVVDYREGAMAEAGDLLIPMSEGLISPEHIVAELGEIILGSKPGRTSDGDVTLYKSVGVAVQDLAAASEVLERSKALGLGLEVAL